MKHTKKGMNKIIIGVITMSLILSPFTVIWAGDYPDYLKEPQYVKDRIQHGFSIETLVWLGGQTEKRIDNMNLLLDLVSGSHQASHISAKEIFEIDTQKLRNARHIEKTIHDASKSNTKHHTTYTDGKTVFYDPHTHLPIETINERVVDSQFGLLNIKHTYNMEFNDKRLLIGYDADLVDDSLGNTTYIHWDGEYTDYSLFYGGPDINANKHLAEYTFKETDSAGNIKLTQWQALSYDGKLLSAFSQTIDDSVYGVISFTQSNIKYEDGNHKRVCSYHEQGVGTDGLHYTLNRTNITYTDIDKNQVTGYDEVKTITQVDGTKTKITTHAQFQYLEVPHQFGPDVEEQDPDRLLASTITTTTINADGSERDETTITNYAYNNKYELINAYADNVFTGQEASWFEYTDSQGHILSRYQDEDSNVIYSYIDADTYEKIFVAAEEVTATLKPGNKFKGSSHTQFDTRFGTPMALQTDSIISYYGQNISEGELVRIETSSISYTNDLVNNLPRVLNNQEHTEVTFPLTDPENTHREIRDISSTYFYDKKGNLVDVQGTGEKTGWEYTNTRGWWGKHTSTITIDYDVILGKAVRTIYHEDKDYEGDIE